MNHPTSSFSASITAVCLQAAYRSSTYTPYMLPRLMPLSAKPTEISLNKKETAGRF